jgi:hypothetical protein
VLAHSAVASSGVGRAVTVLRLLPGLPFGAVWLYVTAQNDACRLIYQMGLFARSADDRLVCVGIHDYIVGGKALNAKAPFSCSGR